MNVRIPLTPGCERLLADAADRRHESGQRDLAGHGDVRFDSRARLRRWPVAIVAVRRSVLRNGSGRHVDVRILLAEKVGQDSELAGLLANVAERGAPIPAWRCRAARSA